jgi:hypothetical protein
VARVLRLFGVSMVFAGAAFLAWGAAGAATTERAVFRVSLTGTLTKDWTAARTVEGECTEVTTHTGHWRMTLKSRRRSRLVFTAPSGRRRRLTISPAVIRAIAGNATQSGAVRVVVRGPGCENSIQQRTCARRRAAFRNATVRLTTLRAGRARFARLQGVSAARSFRGSCPEQPADIRALRTDLGLADAPLAGSDVFGRDVPRFFISGNTTQETTIEGEDDGRVTERVRWTLTFTRVA